MALVLTGGDSDVISISPSASINNLSAGSALMWVNLTSITPGANGNFWGKSSAGNRNSAFINIATGEVRVEIGGSTAAQARATNANLPNYAANKWVCIAFTWNVGTTAPKIFTGDLTNDLAEASAYAFSVVGTYGTHDDSASPWNIGNSGSTPGTGSNSLPGSIAVVQIFNRELTLAELKSLFRPRNISGTVHYGEYGYTGTTTQADWSGNGNSGAITGATVGAHVPLGPIFGFDAGWEGLSAGSPNVTVALSGVAASVAAGVLGVSMALGSSGVTSTAAVGTVTHAHGQAVTGVVGTGSAGSVTQSTTIALTGVAANSGVGSVSTGADVTTALTGVVGTGAVGSLAPSRTVPITGVAGTGAVGTVTPSGGAGGNVTLAITGVGSTGGIGSVTAESAKAIVGNAATGSPGSVTPSRTVPLTGTAATGAVGTVTPSSAGPVTVALTGVSSTGSVGSVTASGGDALSDSSAVDAAIVAALLADSQLTALMPHGVYFDIGPAEKTRFVLITQVTHEDDYVFEGSAWEQFSYLVKAVSKATTGNTSGSDVKAAAARIHAVLQDAPLTIAGYTHMLTRRSERVRYTEVDDVDKDTRWHHRGGRYDVFVSPI